jgi:phage terminase small subunit
MTALANAKHERFAQELAKGKTADEAYVIAGYKENRGNAATLKAKQNILDRILELQSRAADKAVVTIQDIAIQLDEDRTFARSVNSASAAVAATLGKAKVLGLVVDKSELSGPGGGPIKTEDMNARDEVNRRIAGLAARSGQDGDNSRLN